MLEINPTQITFARVRRLYTKVQLAKEIGVSTRSLQSYEKGDSPVDKETLAKIAKVLNFPVSFFFIEEDMPAIADHSVSFRRLSKMTDGLKQCSFATAAIAFKVNDWVEEKFNLTQADLPDLSDLSPEEAAITLRQLWNLGNAPIPNMIHLLESKGVRVFSLVEETNDVDAFCTWYGNKPFVFLSTKKSAERSRFDAAHELGHLVRDLYSMKQNDPHNPKMEQEADAFASAFLMPRESILANQPPSYTIPYLMKLKKHWKVSLVALTYRFNSLGLISEWGYRNLCIEIAKRGYRSKEPEPMERETSQVLTKVLSYLDKHKQGRSSIAKSLNICESEIDGLTFKLAPSRLKLVV